MVISILRHLFSFILLAGLQVFVLNNLNINSFVNPQVFILFLLLLPVNADIWLCLIAGFVSGAVVDGLAITNGIHAFSGTALGYFRYFYIKYSLDKEVIERGMNPNIRNMPTLWHVTYLVFSSLFYHWIVFFMEAFRLSDLGLTSTRAMVSGIIAAGLMILIGFLFSRKTTNV